MLFPRIVLSLFFAAAFAAAISPPEGELGQGCSQEFVDIGTLEPKHLKIYMADLPRKYTTDLYDQYWDFSYYDRMTWGAPFGKRNPQGDGSLWNSNQYSTGLWFHKQIASSPLRVFDAAEADVVFVPIFTTYLVGYWHSYKRTKAKDVVASFYQEAHKLLPLLGQKPHFVILARMEVDYTWLEDNFDTGHGMTSKIYENVTRHLTFLTIEIDKNIWGSKEAKELHGLNRISIPYPGMSHFYRGSSKLAQKHSSRMHSRVFMAAASFNSKTVLRKSLSKQCIERNTSCLHVEIDDHSHFASTILRVEWFMSSAWFCFQPTGDTYSRRSLFDCLAMGSIPVIFDSFWPKAFPFSDIVQPQKFLVDLSSSVDDINNVDKGSNVVDILESKYPPDARAEMLRGVFSHRHLFQYMLDPIHELLRVDKAWEVHCTDDAFTMSLKSLVRNLCRRGLLPTDRCKVDQPALL